MIIYRSAGKYKGVYAHDFLPTDFNSLPLLNFFEWRVGNWYDIFLVPVCTLLVAKTFVCYFRDGFAEAV